MGKLVSNKLFALVGNYFNIYLPNIRKYSPNTTRAYQKALELFLDFVKSKKQIKLFAVKFEMIDNDMVTSFLDYLEKERGCSVSTRNHRLHCIRSFYVYAAETDITTAVYWNEIKKIKSATTEESTVKHMSEVAIDVILDQPNTASQKGLRDMFLMLFLYQTGARIGELLDIKLCDIHFTNTPTVTLHGKGVKVRSVPLRAKEIEHFKKYIAVFHPNEDIYSKQFLFYVLRNKEKKRMTDDNARRLIYNYGAKAREFCKEVPDNVHPHLFRHSRAMHLYQNGVDLILISQWLGHSSLETTLIYAHADTELKRKAIEKAIPLDSPLRQHVNSERYKLDDDDLLKQLCGLK